MVANESCNAMMNNKSEANYFRRISQSMRLAQLRMGSLPEYFNDQSYDKTFTDRFMALGKI